MGGYKPQHDEGVLFPTQAVVPSVRAQRHALITAVHDNLTAYDKSTIWD